MPGTAGPSELIIILLTAPAIVVPLWKVFSTAGFSGILISNSGDADDD